MTATILQLFPEYLDVNGDAQNALVLAQRAHWAGIDVNLSAIHVGDRVPSGRPSAIVIGSSVDADLELVLRALAPWSSALGEWINADVPVLAVGTGLELLSNRVSTSEHDIEGLGLFAGEAKALDTRAAGDLVVESEWSQLVGYENHARGLTLGSDVSALGVTASGIGNGGGHEGVRMRGLIGTHLHGPFLAKNPGVADSMLGAAFGNDYANRAPEIQVLDNAARAARAATTDSLGL